MDLEKKIQKKKIFKIVEHGINPNQPKNKEKNIASMSINDTLIPIVRLFYKIKSIY